MFSRILSDWSAVGSTAACAIVRWVCDHRYPRFDSQVLRLGQPRPVYLLVPHHRRVLCGLVMNQESCYKNHRPKPSII